jgi:hypothetical protein
MVLLPYLVSFVLMLSNPALTLASTPPVPAPRAAVKPQAPPTDATVSVAPADRDGYARTVTAFQYYAQKAAEIQALLKKLHNESVTGAPSDVSKQRALFLTRLVETYPGSTFDGTTGTVPFQNNFVATYNATLTVDTIKEIGKITAIYHLTQGKITLSFENNSVTAIIDQTTPSRSTFINVSIPAMKENAEKTLADPDRKMILVDTVESAVLNDAYQLLSQTSRVRMDTFAAGVIRNPALQEEALRTAAIGYRERHPEEYQKGVAPDKPRKKKTDATSNKPADARFYESCIKWMLLVVSAITILWAVLAGIRYLKSLSLDTSEKMKQDRYNSLTPMVTKCLKNMGVTLWGRNWPWSKNYYIYQRSERWLLCDGKEDKNNNIFKARTRVEVSLRSTYFKIKISRLNKASVDISLACRNLSKGELLEGLEKLRCAITTADRAETPSSGELT